MRRDNDIKAPDGYLLGGLRLVRADGGSRPHAPLTYTVRRLWERIFPRKSALETWAESELARLLGDPDGDDLQRVMNRHLLRMVRAFSREGHSGGSAGYAIGVLEKLLRWEPVTPLTGDDSEWNDIGDMSAEPMWQNNRCSRVFKGADGRAYDIDGRIFVEPDGIGFNGRGSRVYVTFPYTPTTTYVKVGDDGEPLEGPTREELATPAHATPEEASKTGAPSCPGTPSNKASQ